MSCLFAFIDGFSITQVTSSVVEQVHSIGNELKNGDHIQALEKYNRLAAASNVIEVRFVSLLDRIGLSDFEILTKFLLFNFLLFGVSQFIDSCM